MQLGSVGGHGDLGLDVEVPTERLDRRLEPEVHLGAFDLGAPSPLARRFQLALCFVAIGPQAVEPGSGGPLGLALPAATFTQIGQVGLDAPRGES